MNNLYTIDEFYKIYTNALDLLEDRGYKYTGSKLDFKMFSRLWERIDDNIILGDDTGTFVIYVSRDTSRFVKNDFKTYFSAVTSKYKKVKKIIFGIGGNITKKVLKYHEAGYTIEFIKSSNLLLNPARHEYVPPHRLITPVEAEELLKSYVITGDNLPKILQTDPISIWYGAKPGDIFEIRRTNGGTKKINMEANIGSIYFRIVV